jgi:hypothetical protein
MAPAQESTSEWDDSDSDATVQPARDNGISTAPPARTNVYARQVVGRLLLAGEFCEIPDHTVERLIQVCSHRCQQLTVAVVCQPDRFVGMWMPLAGAMTYGQCCVLAEQDAVTRARAIVEYARAAPETRHLAASSWSDLIGSVQNAAYDVRAVGTRPSQWMDRRKLRQAGWTPVGWAC